MRRYFVVHFPDDVPPTVSAVPSRWVEDQVCAWPPLKGSKLTRAIIQCDPPSPDWPRCKINIMYKTDSYQKAKAKVTQAMIHSDVQTCSEKESRRSRKRKMLSSSDEENNVPAHHKSQVYESQTNDFMEVNKPSPSTSRDMYNGFAVTTSSPSILPPFNSHARFDDSTFQEMKAKESRNDLFQRKVIKFLVGLVEDVNEIKQRLAESVAAKLPSKLPEGCPNLPVEHVEDMIEFNQFLKNSDDCLQVRLFYSCLGGMCYKDCTRRVLAKLISNPLSMKYNWKGSRGEKLAFSNQMCVVKLICDTVRAHKQFEDATDAQIHEAIKKWLMHSKDRDGGRSSRLLENGFK